MDYFKRIAKHTPTRFWVNNVTRSQADLAIAAGAVGATQNPAYLSKVMGSTDDGEWIRSIMRGLVREIDEDSQVVSELQRIAIAEICARFRPLYDQSGGRSGFVSIQADPFHEDAGSILDNAEKCVMLADNFIIKIPAVKEGLEAIAALIRRRIPVLVTEVMSIDQVFDVCSLYEEQTGGLKDAAPFFIAHINGIFDEHLAEMALRDNVGLAPDILRQASLLLARKMIGYMRERGWGSVHYLAGGARGLHHFTDWVGVNGAVTINWKGTADRLIEMDGGVVDVFNAPSSHQAIDSLLEKLPDFRKAWVPGSLKADDYDLFGPVVKFRRLFEDGWENVLEAVSRCRKGES